MPDHLHGNLILEPAPEETAASLVIIMGTFKSKAIKSIRAMGYRDFDWQDRFHDHILKNAQELEKARTYIRETPAAGKRKLRPHNLSLGLTRHRSVETPQSIYANIP